MPKSSKSKKKQEASISANINIGGDVASSNIIVGHGNTINVEAAKAVYGLFTIPPPVSDFTGREDELKKLKDSFSNGAIIIGVSGGGGIGKTELARKLAQEIADDFPDARLSIDLLGTSENPMAAEEAMRRLLEAFYPNQKLPDEPEQLKGLFQQTFAAQKALLLLDNAANATQVRPLIPPKPSAAIITSRLHFSLTESGLKEPLRLDVLKKEEAIQLLGTASVKLAGASNEDLNSLAKLCGYLPLALRVVASLLNDRPDWTIGSLIKRLTDERTRLQRLKREGDVDLDVETALSVSYQALDEGLKQRFRQLSVFTAPFIEDSARVVWNMEEDEQADDALGKLVNRSLVNILLDPIGEGQGSEVIYGYALHDLTRLFGMNRLLENEEETKAAIMRHAEHFLQWASEADDLYQKGNENILVGLAQFRFIWPHLNTAYERLLPGQKTFPRPETADAWLSNFPGMCTYVLDLYVPPRQKIPNLEAALEAARRLDEKQAEGVYLGNLGQAYAALGETRKAIEFYEQALAIAREIGDRRGEGADLGSLGQAYAALGETRKAIEFYEQALAIAREIGDRRNEGVYLSSLGQAYAALGETRKAIEFYEQGLSIDREIGDRRGEGVRLGNLGQAYAALGETRKAIEFYEQALAIAREIGDRRGEGADLGSLGQAYADLGETRKAIEFYEQALAIAREIGDRRGEGADLGSLGQAYADLGETRKAIEFYEQALAIAREIGDRRNEGVYLSSLGQAYADLGETRKAIEFYEQALAIAREIGDRRNEGVYLSSLGQAYADLGEENKAQEYIDQLQAIADDEEIGYDLWLNIGNIHSRLENHEAAVEAYNKAVSTAPRVGMLYRNRASEFIYLDNWVAAEQDLNMAQNLEPDHPYLNVRKGDLAFWQKQFEEAKHNYEQALKKSENPEWFFALGLSLFGIGKVNEAIANIKESAKELTEVTRQKWLKELERARKVLPEDVIELARREL